MTTSALDIERLLVPFIQMFQQYLLTCLKVFHWFLLCIMKSVRAARSFLVFLYNATKHFVDCFRLCFLSICTLLFRLEYSMCLIFSWPHYFSFLASLHRLSCESIYLIYSNHCKFSVSPSYVSPARLVTLETAFLKGYFIKDTRRGTVQC